MKTWRLTKKGAKQGYEYIVTWSEGKDERSDQLLLKMYILGKDFLRTT